MALSGTNSSIRCIKRYKFALIFIELFSKISVMRSYAFMRKYIDEHMSFQNKRPIKLAVFPTVDVTVTHLAYIFVVMCLSQAALSVA